MSSRSHDALVARLTEYARKHPRGYRARVAGLALLGYAYLFAALTLLAGLVAVLVFFILKNFGAYIILKAVVPFVVLIWLIGKSLWVRFTPPEGMEVRKADAPRLMEEIERAPEGARQGVLGGAAPGAAEIYRASSLLQRATGRQRA